MVGKVHVDMRHETLDAGVQSQLRAFVIRRDSVYRGGEWFCHVIETAVACRMP